MTVTMTDIDGTEIIVRPALLASLEARYWVTRDPRSYQWKLGDEIIGDDLARVLLIAVVESDVREDHPRAGMFPTIIPNELKFTITSLHVRGRGLLGFPWKPTPLQTWMTAARLIVEEKQKTDGVFV